MLWYDFGVGWDAVCWCARRIDIASQTNPYIRRKIGSMLRKCFIAYPNTFHVMNY